MLHHIGLYVRDLNQSQKFYKKILGIQEQEKIKWNGSELIFLKGDGFQIELIHEPLIEPKGAHFAFHVPNVKEKMRELKKAGFTPSEGPYQLVNGWQTVLYEGPDGEEIEFLQTL
jgi:lactoylglutathione lyase